jgi:hypothetical protein
MLAMSVNDVPGWFVTIPPSGIGVPAAFTPGLVPHCDVTDAAALPALGVVAGLLLVEVLPHPAAATSPTAAASAAAPRAPGACCLILT